MTSLPNAVVAAVALTMTAVDAQPLPDFSGTWTMDRERSESLHQSQPIEPPTAGDHPDRARAHHRDAARAPSTTTTVYTIGPRSGAGTPSPAGGSRAYWDGDALVTEGARTVQGQTVSVRETRTLDDSGGEMTVQTLLVVQHGYSFRGAKNYGASKDVFRRAVALKRRDRRCRPVLVVVVSGHRDARPAGGVARRGDVWSSIRRRVLHNPASDENRHLPMTVAERFAGKPARALGTKAAPGKPMCKFAVWVVVAGLAAGCAATPTPDQPLGR